jgi:hypothetical protein
MSHYSDTSPRYATQHTQNYNCITEDVPLLMVDVLYHNLHGQSRDVFRGGGQGGGRPL